MKYITYIALLLITVFLSPMLSSLVPQYSLWWWVIVAVYLIIIGAVYAAVENGSRKK